MQKLACILLPALSAAAATTTLPAGTEMKIRLEQDVAPGEKNNRQFQALLVYGVFVDGREVLPAETRVEGEVRGSKKSVVLSPKYLYLPGGQRVDFNAAVSEISHQRLKAEQREGTIEKSGSKADATRQAAEIGMTGAGVGAMSTGSAKGMGIGAAAGVAAVLIGRKIAGRQDTTVIPAGTQLTLQLSRAIELPEDVALAPNPTPPPGDPGDRRPVLRRND
jgi:hypothetical protein